MTDSTLTDPPAGRSGRSATTRYGWVLMAVVVLFYLGCATQLPIFDEDSGLYAGAVREMKQSGDWLTPTVNGYPRIQKPPLLYWSMLVSTSALGVNEFALQLPNTLATIGWFAVMFLIVKELGGEELALCSMLVVSTMIGVYVFTRQIHPEPFLALFIALSLLCLIKARTGKQPVLWYHLCWGAMALGTLSKGLHGALWPLGAVVLTALLFPRTRGWLKRLFSISGLLLFFCIVTPWYIYMSWRWPHFLASHFLNEQLGGAVSTRYPVVTHQPLRPFYLHLLMAMMPWIFVLPASAYALCSGWKKLEPAARDGVCLIGVLTGGELASLIYSSHLTYYGLSVWGLFAPLLALPWVMGKMPVWLRLNLGGTALVIAGVGIFYLGMTGRLLAMGPFIWPDISMSKLNRSLFVVLPAIGADSAILLGLIGTALLGGGILSAWLSYRERGKAAVLSLAAAQLVLLTLGNVNYGVLSPYLSLATTAQKINAELPSSTNPIVVWDGMPIQGSSLYYYLDAHPHWVNGLVDDEYAQRVLRKGRDLFLNEEELTARWKSGDAIFLIIPDERLEHWKEILPPNPRVVFQSGNRVVLSNH